MTLFKSLVQNGLYCAIGKRTGFPWSGPIALTIEIINTPPSMSTTASVLSPGRLWDDRGSGSKYSGDFDNFEKSIADALSGSAWTDDCQVAKSVTTVQAAAEGEEPHCVITIEKLTEPPE